MFKKFKRCKKLICLAAMTFIILGYVATTHLAVLATYPGLTW
ncbi:hypothetical protein CLAUR_027470 [Clostridium felsineum]|nr:hypothetical protein CLAUR_027470 [Clostridium felsineum]